MAGLLGSLNLLVGALSLAEKESLIPNSRYFTLKARGAAMSVYYVAANHDQTAISDPGVARIRTGGAGFAHGGRPHMCKALDYQRQLGELCSKATAREVH
jgi:hypothetical protein